MKRVALATLAAFAALAVTARASGAQRDALLDSADVARASWRSAASARTPEAALPLVVRAANAWPMQPAYWVSLARLAALAHDTTQLLRAAAHLDSMQLAPTLVQDSLLWRVLSALDPRRAATLASTAAPIRGGRLLAEIADTTFFAEGVDADPRTRTLYVASIRHRTVVAVHHGATRDLQLHRDPRIGAVFGVRLAADRRTLWCTTAPHVNAERVADAAERAAVVPSLVEVDVTDGTIRRVVPLPPPSAATSRLPGDLAIAPDGSILISDSDVPAILHYRPTTGAWTILADSRWRSPQGIAVLPGHDAVILADWSHGLFRVDLETHAITRVHIPDGMTVLGLDGIVWSGGGIIGVQNGVSPARIVHVRLTTAGDSVTAFRILDRQPALASEPTVGTLLDEGYVYVANSQWPAYDEGRRTQVSLEPTRLVCVPLAPDSRNGTRSTASAPPASPSCSVSVPRSP